MKTSSLQSFYRFTQRTNQFAHENPRFLSFILMLIGTAGLVYFFLTLLPPPSLVTRERIKILEKHIRAIKTVNPSAVIDLISLQKNSTDKISILDGWERPILYRQITEQKHELISYGEDGVPGGKPDFIYNFNL